MKLVPSHSRLVIRCCTNDAEASRNCFDLLARHSMTMNTLQEPQRSKYGTKTCVRAHDPSRARAQPHHLGVVGRHVEANGGRAIRHDHSRRPPCPDVEMDMVKDKKGICKTASIPSTACVHSCSGISLLFRFVFVWIPVERM